MCAFDKNDDLGNLLQAGYGAPPPREAFVRGLGQRMRGELRASQKAVATARPRRAIPVRWQWALAAAATVVLAAGIAAIALRPDGGGTPQRLPSVGGPPGPEPSSTPEEKMVPLEIKLPRALVDGTAKNIKPSPYLENFDGKPRPPFLAPEGTVNLTLGKPVTASDAEPIIGELKLITDGDKEGSDGSFVELGPGKQWVQVDLKEPCTIYAVVVWHYHGEGRVYHDAVVQVADDPDFIENPKTVYNNDYDNSSGLGIGQDLEYVENYQGRLINAQGVQGRYVRLYSKGNTSNDQNHYIEVEVYGKPLAPAPAAAPAAAPAKGAKGETGPEGPTTSCTTTEKMAPLEIRLPRPRYVGTPRYIKPSPYLEKPDYRPRPPFMVPQGTTNVALGRPVTSSDLEPIIGELKQTTDGDKEGADGSFVELGPGKQWVQIDLKEVCHLYAILLWHGEHWMNVYHDVIVQVSNNREFIKGVTTLFNNDYDNSSGLGAGKNLEYIEDYRGRLIDAQAVMARFVRIYSKGNIDNDMNHYVEVEVYGRPAPAEAADLAPLEIELPHPICY
jgi:hypothetical protein